MEGETDIKLTPKMQLLLVRSRGVSSEKNIGILAFHAIK
jgi:hypothetical protein